MSGTENTRMARSGGRGRGLRGGGITALVWGGVALVWGGVYLRWDG